MIEPKRNWTPAFLAVIAVGAALAVGYAQVLSRSQRELEAAHAQPTSAVRADTSADGVARGAHLVSVTACAICHGQDLSGKMLGVAGGVVYAPNLTQAAPRLTDAELERSIRRGLRPDGRSELAMPSHVYAAFTDGEVAAIIGYLRTLPPTGRWSHQPSPEFLLRLNLATGAFRTEAARMARRTQPLDAGPATAAGRHLAALACGQCHGGDLGGGKGAPGPDLAVRGDYDRRQFHTLLHTGEGMDERDLGLMAQVAKTNFSHFSDGEIDAIYDYLDARDRLLGARERNAAAAPR